MPGPAAALAVRQDRQRHALAVPTRRRIFELIAGAAGGMGVADLAAACGVHQNTVRLHVDRLVEVGLIAEEHERPAHRGRPAYRYRAIADPRRDGGEDYRMLAGWLAEAVRTRSSAREVGRRVGAAERDQGGSGDVVTAILESFARLGFAPRRVDRADARADADADADDVTIALQACPFAEAAAADPATICSLHRGIAEGIAERDPGIAVDGLDVAKDPHAGGCRLRMHRTPS